MKKQIFGIVSCALAFVLTAGAETMDRPSGFKIGQRLTLKPYVDLSFVYDSNADAQPSGEQVCSWVVNPGLSLAYKAENWVLDLSAYYRYTAYSKYVNSLNQHNYGETLNWRWSDAKQNEKGWSLMLTESYQRVNEDDDIQDSEGRGLWRDRQQFRIAGAVQRRITDKLHADVNASYYMLDYDNDQRRYAALYGWQRWVGGAEVGYAASRWTDILLAANYQRYYQDNSNDRIGYSDLAGTRGRYSQESEGFSVMAGLGSYATDRISYRALVGWSRFEYADVATTDGFVYSLTGNWKISDTWQTMLLAQSSYQPSEREYGTANRVDSISWGIAKSMVRGKLNATADVAYRRQTREYTDASAYDYDQDIFSARFGLNYALNRFLVAFGRFEYQGSWFSGNMGRVDRDYDRLRFTVGVRLTY